MSREHSGATPLRPCRLAWWGGLLAVAASLGGTSAATAQQTSPPMLTIEAADSGKAVFDGFVPELAEISGLATPPLVKHASALAVLRDFCLGVGGDSPDIVLTTRRLSTPLANDCTKNGVEHMAQVELGHGALVLAVRPGSALTGLTARQVYLALARDVPDSGEFRRNSNVQWSDIDPSLPRQDIRFAVPARDAGERALFDSLILEAGCREDPLVKLIFDAGKRTARCITMRVDRVREIPADQTVHALLDAPVGTVGVLSTLDLERAGDQLVPLALDGIRPTDEAIVQGRYDYASPYWLYAKRGQALRGRPAAIDIASDRILSASLTETVLGPGGALSQWGLVPLSRDKRIAQRAVFAARPNPYSMTPMIDWVGSSFGAVRSLLALSFGGSAGADTPDTLDFTKLMDIAGYKTQEFQTSVGLFPGAGMTFGIVREMSEADQDYLERRLSKDARMRPGQLANMQRKIVRSVLDVSETGDYEISQVVIELLPLPSFKLVVTPKDTPVSQDTTSILRAIERLSDRISEISQ